MDIYEIMLSIIAYMHISLAFLSQFATLSTISNHSRVCSILHEYKRLTHPLRPSQFLLEVA